MSTINRCQSQVSSMINYEFQEIQTSCIPEIRQPNTGLDLECISDYMTKDKNPITVPNQQKPRRTGAIKLQDELATLRENIYTDIDFIIRD